MIAYLNQLTMPGANGFAAIVLGVAFVISAIVQAIGMNTTYINEPEEDR